MRLSITLTLITGIATAVWGVASAQEIQEQLANDPIAQACKLLADQGNETAAEHYAAIRAQLEANAETEREGAPEGAAVREFQQTMRAAAEARAWCGAVPIQTSPGAPAHTDDPDMPKEWIRQSMLSSYQGNHCDKALKEQQSGEAYQQCSRMRRQLDEWASYYEE